MKHYDLLILGAGTAGLSAANEAAKHTDNFAVIEKGPMGTMCALRGCMPSKALIEAANACYNRYKLERFGIEGAEKLSVNLPQVLSHVRNLRDGFVEGVIHGMDRYEVIRGTGHFRDMHTIEVNGETYAADAILIATGSTPRIPKEFANYKNEILTTDTLFEQNNLPDSMAVIGLGSIGVEMGQALSRLGIAVTGFDPGLTLAGISDPGINTEAKKILAREMVIYGDNNITSVEKTGGGYRLCSENHAVEVGQVLVSAGRIPNLEGLGLDKLDIPFEDHVPQFDPDTLQIADLPLYIAGDVNSDRALQHEAADEGRIAVQHALKVSDPYERRTPLLITFTDPPIIRVGKAWRDIKDSDPLIGEVSYEHQGRARMEQKNEGKARIYAAQDGTLLGAEMMAPAADHTAHLFALAIQESLNISSLLSLPYYHPTLEEAFRGALGKMEKQRRQAA